MQVEEELVRFSPGEDTLLAIGVFDGVHLGHKYLISQLIDKSRAEGLHGSVVTFHPHPREVLFPTTEVLYLTTITERASLLSREGVETVITLSFTPELAEMTARQFVNLLKKHLRMRGLVVGPDFALGKSREGNVDTLRALGQELDFSMTVIPEIKTNSDVISSTTIRSALAGGNMKQVNKLLGRRYSLQGKVTTGAGRGAGLGFPTANLSVDPKKALPPEGVYVTWTYLDGRRYQSMTNIGRRLTFGENQLTIEVLIMDYQDNLYGHELRVDIVERLRDEKRFNTVDELKKQIAADVEQGRAILSAQVRE
ncbi:MAG TPA: bifunctional riboflavin kinase/FAD synthetase [Dehalococcoidia bacterium]|nr:bifunctional riboflavin kinase/FAD synthetase [Dehalococcoidia bacterium]